jgi:hypothetical protein
MREKISDKDSEMLSDSFRTTAIASSATAHHLTHQSPTRTSGDKGPKKSVPVKTISKTANLAKR